MCSNTFFGEEGEKRKGKSSRYCKEQEAVKNEQKIDDSKLDMREIVYMYTDE